jgi:hypothetical protein
LVIAALMHVPPHGAAFSSPEKLTGRFGGRDFLSGEPVPLSEGREIMQLDARSLRLSGSGRGHSATTVRQENGRFSGDHPNSAAGTRKSPENPLRKSSLACTRRVVFPDGRGRHHADRPDRHLETQQEASGEPAGEAGLSPQHLSFVSLQTLGIRLLRRNYNKVRRDG